MPSKRALEADTYADSLCLLAQATKATRKSDVGMKSAGNFGYILACKSSQCPVQFKVVITQGISLQEGNELLWVADVEVQGLVTGMDGDFAEHHHTHTRISTSKNILAKDTSLSPCHKAWLLKKNCLLKAQVLTSPLASLPFSRCAAPTSLALITCAQV
jgi:hypothetical protein